VFENRVLRGIFRPKKVELTGSGEKYIMMSFMICTAHQILFGNQIENEMGWACSVRGGERKCTYRVLVERPEGLRPIGGRRRRWEDNIKMDLQEVGWGDIDEIHLAQDRDRWRALVKAVMNFQVP
jgi:hypothetical protein